MKTNSTFTLSILAALLLSLCGIAQQADSHATGPPQTIRAPTPKRQYGVCHSSWCETGSYSSPAVANLDGDGKMEVIAAPYTLFILNGEGGSVQWSIDPSGSRVWPGVVIADLEGDGDLEIIYPSYAGRMHAFWLDKTEHGNWPYSIYNAAEGFYRFASEAVLADLDNDGYSEAIFSSCIQKGSDHAGKLHVLDHLGRSLTPAVSQPMSSASSPPQQRYLSYPIMLSTINLSPVLGLRLAPTIVAPRAR